MAVYAVNYGLMVDPTKETITFRNTEEMRVLAYAQARFLCFGDGLGGGRALNGIHEFPLPYDFQIKTI